MTTLRTLLIFSARAFAALGAAVATMMLGWIITAHAAYLFPDEADRANPILCERIPGMICQPDVPGLLIKPAILVVPAIQAATAGLPLTNF